MFVLVNALVMVTINIVLSVLGVQPYLTQNGLDMGSLMAFCLVWGFGGALISLALSRIMAKMMMRVRVVPKDSRDPMESRLVERVHQLARSAGLNTMPEVGVYESPEVNAFATGPTKNRALVAVSTGLLNRLDGQAVDGVLGHEIAHIANGDMVTMTLVQGVVNAFVMFFARIIAWAIANAVESRNRPMVHMLSVIVLEILLSFLGMMVVAYFSRWREYRADAGGARFAGQDSMIHALKSLQRSIGMVEQDHPSLASFKINGRKPSGLLALFSTHPPLEERIARLETMRA